MISSGGVCWGVVNSLIASTATLAMHAKFGQTIGKMVTRVKVVDVSESRNLTLKQSCMRDIVPIMLIPLVSMLTRNSLSRPDLGKFRASAEPLFLLGTQ
ncbi:RDD family protein [Vibrio chagasii]|nr:RDD family protein [Vibrio chagasii]